MVRLICPMLQNVPIRRNVGHATVWTSKISGASLVGEYGWFIWVINWVMRGMILTPSHLYLRMCSSTPELESGPWSRLACPLCYRFDINMKDFQKNRPQQLRILQIDVSVCEYGLVIAKIYYVSHLQKF